MAKIIDKYLDSQSFSDKEAWGIFKLFAIAEAGGWTMLICGIVISRYITPGNNIAVDIAGNLHGMIFLGYLLAVIATGATLRWSLQRIIFGIFVSLPPYGTLLFELWQAHLRYSDKRKLLIFKYFQSHLSSTT